MGLWLGNSGRNSQDGDDVASVVQLHFCDLQFFPFAHFLSRQPTVSLAICFSIFFFFIFFFLCLEAANLHTIYGLPFTTTTNNSWANIKSPKKSLNTFEMRAEHNEIININTKWFIGIWARWRRRRKGRFLADQTKDLGNELAFTSSKLAPLNKLLIYCPQHTHAHSHTHNARIFEW